MLLLFALYLVKKPRRSRAMPAFLPHPAQKIIYPKKKPYYLTIAKSDFFEINLAFIHVDLK